MIKDGRPYTGRTSGGEIVKLRALMDAHGYDAVIVPSVCSFRQEYPDDSERRLRFISGFTGSAGTAVITADRKVLLTDGRYQVQARKELGWDWEIVNSDQISVAQWMKDNIPPNSRVFANPALFTDAEIRGVQDALTPNGSGLGFSLPSPQPDGKELFSIFKAPDKDPIDHIWGDERPEPPRRPIFVLDEQFAGKPAAEKKAEIIQWMHEQGIHALPLTEPSDVAWLLNIRGSDVPCTPVPLVRAIVQANGVVELYSDNFLDERVRIYLRDLTVRINPLKHFLTHLSQKVPTCEPIEGHKRDILTYPSMPANVKAILAPGSREGENPITWKKAIKNPGEIANMTACHIRDGAALTRALHWLYNAKASDGLTELAVADRLEEFRRQAHGDRFLGLSFPTVAGFGPKGAIVHYRATEDDHALLDRSGLLLIDSGAQCLDGTTDVTRTILLGHPAAEDLATYRKHYTAVLKGHIAVASARLPAARAFGPTYDVLARAALVAAGIKDFGHGTGHGVGFVSGVHEGPVFLSTSLSNIRSGNIVKPDMVLSNEPGYYEEGAYGIRIENLLTSRLDDNGNIEWDNLTMAPYDRRLLDFSMLTATEARWIDAYHEQVWKNLESLVPAEDGTRDWLWEQVKPISRTVGLELRKQADMMIQFG